MSTAWMSQPGDRWSVVADMWVRTVDGVEHNAGKYEHGVVVRTWHEPGEHGQSGKDFVELGDGRVFMRYDCYYPPSPYGWNEVLAPEHDAYDHADFGVVR